MSVVHHKSDKIMDECPSIKALWSNEKLLDAVEQIVGPDIAGHPVWNLRIKLPQHHLEEVPWHQDNGYFEDDARGTMICTAWIPLMDTHKQNGGMAMVRKTHQKGRVTRFSDQKIVSFPSKRAKWLHFLSKTYHSGNSLTRHGANFKVKMVFSPMHSTSGHFLKNCTFF